MSCPTGATKKFCQASGGTGMPATGGGQPHILNTGTLTNFLMGCENLFDFYRKMDEIVGPGFREYRLGSDAYGRWARKWTPPWNQAKPSRSERMIMDAEEAKAKARIEKGRDMMAKAMYRALGGKSLFTDSGLFSPAKEVPNAEEALWIACQLAAHDKDLAGLSVVGKRLVDRLDAMQHPLSGLLDRLRQGGVTDDDIRRYWLEWSLSVGEDVSMDELVRYPDLIAKYGSP